MLAPTHLPGPPHCLPTAQVKLEPGRRSTTMLTVVIANLEIQYCIRPKPSLTHRTIMSDKEMNIDEGILVDPFPFTPGHLILSLKWPKVACAIKKVVVDFRVQQVCRLALCTALRLGSHANVVTLSW
jgi:hypothetical protein